MGIYSRKKHPEIIPDLILLTPIEEATFVPSHVMHLAQTSGGRDGYYILIDTERGTITLCDFQDGPAYIEAAPDYTDLSEVEIRILS